MPLACSPQPGEAFDGWLQRAAYLTCAFPAHLLKHLNINTEPLNLPGVTLHSVPAELWPNLAAATDTQPVQWADVMDSPGTYAARIGQPQKPVAAYMAFRKTSRFCPACLHDTGGVWPWAWSLGWYLACPIHHLLLVDDCPSCRGRHAPQRTPRYVVPGSPETCQRPCPSPETLGPATPRCGHLLADAPTQEAPAALVTLTERLLPLTNPAASPDEVASAHRLLLAFAGLAHAAVNTPFDSADPSPKARRLERLRVAAAAAFDDQEAFTRLAAPAAIRRRTQPKPSHWTHVPDHLIELAVTQRRPHLNTYDKMRWNCYSPNTATPTETAGSLRQFIRTLPGLLWPEWALRLIPDDFEISDRLARLHAVTLLTLPGWTGTTAQLVAAWPRPDVTAATTTRMLRLLNAHPHGERCLAALTHLTQHLRDGPSPINYERRRTLTDRITIPDDTWRDWCERSETPAGTGRKRLIAERWLTQTLIGRPPVNDIPELDRHLRGFARTMPETLKTDLLTHARTLLDSNGMGREPITWTPPRDAVPEDLWCGPDPADLTSDRQQAAERVPSARQAALLAEMGLHREPAPPQPRRPKHLTETSLREEMTTEGVNVRVVAAKFGVNRKTVTDRCHRYCLPIRPAGRTKHHVDPALLRDLYLDQRLTLREVAEQTGISPTNVARRLRALGIPARPRGGASHRNNRRAEALPRELALALTGQGGLQRVQRFQNVAAGPSINQTAKRLGISQATLTQQIQRIEHAVGGPILNRNARNNQPHVLTPLGKRLLRQANVHLGIPDSPTPQDGGLCP